MALIGGSIREGSWWLHSKKDSRWNDQGKGIVGGLSVPREAQKSIERNKKLYGDPPDDLEWGYMKD